MNLTIITQLLGVPLLKNCKICNEIEAGNIVRLLLLSQDRNIESDGIFSALKRLKTFLRPTVGNNRLHALILVHVHKNILDNINFADVANKFVDRKDSRK